MKKFVAIIALGSYLLFSTGVVINYHYCMKKLASVQLFSPKKSFCSTCGMHIPKMGGCCHDETVVVKMQDDQNNFSAAALTIPALEMPVTLPSEFIASHTFNINEQRHFHNHSPPLLSAQDTYLQINVFRI